MIEMSNTHTVSSSFEIDENELEELSEINDYWQDSYEFYLDVKDEHIDDMTVSQMNWLNKIEKKLMDRNY